MQITCCETWFFILIFIIYLFIYSKRCQQKQVELTTFIYLCKLLLVTHGFRFNIQYLFIYFIYSISFVTFQLQFNLASYARQFKPTIRPSFLSQLYLLFNWKISAVCSFWWNYNYCKFYGVFALYILKTLHSNYLFKLYTLWCLNYKFLWVHWKFWQYEHTHGGLKFLWAKRCATERDMPGMEDNYFP